MSWAEAEWPEKDSGVELSHGPSEEGDELTQRIVAQVEFYFSDEYIIRNPFLLKQMRRKSEGYVNIKLIASYRRVKSLTKDWEVVRDALRSSTLLQMNAECTKVRRIRPLPDNDETAASRTVVAYPLEDRVGAEAVVAMFSRCGSISLLRMLRPGGPVPPSAKRFMQRHPDAGVCSAAIVEFESHEAALAAESLADPPLHVLPISGRRPRHAASPGRARGHVTGGGLQ